MVVAHILPFAETKTAILTDRDSLLANGVAFKARHMVIPYAIGLIAHIKIRNDRRSNTD